MSEFGKGLSYCLGLFLAHAERYETGINYNPVYWFTGAVDHLFDLEVEQAPKKLKKRIKRFKRKCIRFRNLFSRYKNPTEKDVFWSINEAKELLRLIDKANGINTKKAKYQ